MISFLTYHLQVVILLGVFYLAYFLFLRRTKSFQFNRFYLVATAVFAALIPLVEFKQEPAHNNVVDTFYQTTIEHNYIQPIVTASTELSDTVSTTDYWEYILIGSICIYLLGALVQLVKIILQSITLARLIRKNEITTTFHYKVVNTNGSYQTASFFGYVFWDNTIDYTDEEKTQVLNHELTHIYQFHSIDNILFSVLNILFWYNPIFIKYKEALHDVHEFVADNNIASKSNPQEATEYFHLVGKQALHNLGFSLTNNFHNSNLKKRLTMINSKQNGRNANRMIAAIAVIALSVSGFVYSKELVKKYADTTAIPSSAAPTTKQPGKLELLSIEFENDGTLKWITKIRNSSLPFIVEQFEYDHWIKVDQVDIKYNDDGIDKYSGKVMLHSGKNKFRVKQINDKGTIHLSEPIEFESTTPALNFSINNKNEISFFQQENPEVSAETLYEVYDKFDNIIMKGFSKKVNIINLQRGEYRIIYDGKMGTFSKTTPVTQTETGTSNNDVVMQLHGTCYGKNLFVTNPFTNGGLGFTIKSISINVEKMKDALLTTAIEIDLKKYKIGDKIAIEIVHEKNSLPKIINPEAIATNNESPIITVAGVHDGKLALSKFLDANKIEVSDPSITVVQFEVNFTSKNEAGKKNTTEYESKSNFFTDEMKTAFKAKLKPGTKVYIEKVVLKKEDGAIFKSPGTIIFIAE